MKPTHQILSKRFDVNLCSSPRGYYIQVVVTTILKKWYWPWQIKKVEYFVVNHNSWKYHWHENMTHRERMAFISYRVIDSYTRSPFLDAHHLDSITLTKERYNEYAKMVEQTYRELEVIEQTSLTIISDD